MILKNLHTLILVAILVFPLAAYAQEQAPEQAPSQTPPTDSAAQNLPTAQAAPDAAANGGGTSINDDIVPPEVVILKKIEEELVLKYKNEIYNPPSIQSLIFTPGQQALLREARNGFNAKAPSVDEDKKEEDGSGTTDEKGLQYDEEEQVTAGSRTISLSGIVFISPDDWTIWINKMRITPANLPKQALDLRVYRDFIELQWFDAKSNQVFPIRLRPNQTFNLDGKVFLPG